jgi:hypothetical protein
MNDQQQFRDESVRFGSDYFRQFIRDKIRFLQNQEKLSDLELEASMYSDLKIVLEEYFDFWKLNPGDALKSINDICNCTREVIKEKHIPQHKGITQTLNKKEEQRNIQQ